MTKGQNVRQMAKMMAWALCVAAGAVQAQETPGSQVNPFELRNRYLQIDAQVVQRSYREANLLGQISGGTLNTESGTLGGVGFSSRWQGNWGSVPLLGQFDLSVLSGRTTFDGYAYSGNGSAPGTFTPTQLRTGNLLVGVQYRLGLPLPVAPEVQLTPYGVFGALRWQRDVVSYSVRSTHWLWGAGVLAQWQALPQLTLELDTHLARQSRVRVNAPALGVTLAPQSSQQAELSLAARYRLTEKLTASLAWQHTRWNYGSPVDGRNRQNHLKLGLAWAL